MSVHIVAASVRLFRGVEKYFKDKSITATVDFGDLALTQQGNQGPGRANRVVLCPFDPKTGNAGQITEPSQHGWRDVKSADDPPCVIAQVRALFDWQRLFVVSVWARDDLDTSELAQQAAAETLIEQTARAAHYSGFGTVQLGAINAVLQGERRFGREFRAELRLTHPLFDQPQDVGHADIEITRS